MATWGFSTAAVCTALHGSCVSIYGLASPTPASSRPDSFTRRRRKVCTLESHQRRHGLRRLEVRTACHENTQKLTKIHKKKTGTCGPWSLRCTLQESVSVWNQCSRHCNWKWEKYITDYLNFYGCHLFNLFNRLGIAKAAMLCSRCAILYYEQISW